MANLDQIIDYTKTFQDVELATAIGQLKQNPSQLQQFLQDQQGKVFSDVVKQKDSTFQKVYGDLTRATKAQEAIVALDKRNKELVNVQKAVYENQKNSASAVIDDKNMANRKYEMNQWSVGNKNDTLFVFSMLFIVLSALVLFTTLWRMGLISGALCGSLAALVIIILVLTIINRSQYTNIYRDKRYWNRNTFNQKYGKIPVPQCPGMLSGIEKDFRSMESSINVDIGNISQGISSGAQSLSQGIAAGGQLLSQGVASGAQSLSAGAQSLTSDIKGMTSSAF